MGKLFFVLFHCADEQDLLILDLDLQRNDIFRQLLRISNKS